MPPSAWLILPFVGRSIASDRRARNVRLRAIAGEDTALARDGGSRLPAFCILPAARSYRLIAVFEKKYCLHYFCLTPFSEHHFMTEPVIPAEEKTFRIGLAMAGAISAGAYSAGVLDFLVEAMDAWETENGPDRPPRAAIQVVSGASAGAITGALGAIAMADGPKPVPWTQAERRVLDQIPNPKAASWTPHKCVLPQLYATWVTGPRMVATDGGTALLDTSDTAGTEKLKSLLNTNILDEIKDRALHISGPITPGRYLAEPLDIYMTLSNLTGVTYEIPFKGGTHVMTRHADHAHYRVTGVGVVKNNNRYIDPDGKDEIGIGSLAGKTSPPSDWENYAAAALGSSAFPIGLSAREIGASRQHYEQQSWLWNAHSITAAGAPSPHYLSDLVTDAFRYRTVDGGMMDNEPFPYARRALLAAGRDQNPRLAKDATRAVIMVDPFPDPATFSAIATPPDDLFSIARALFPALVAQTRFKPEELALAADEAVASRYFIAPHRVLPDAKKDDKDNEIEEPFALATGLLGGFGGFLSQSFRDHDFQLGRRNCQKFLRDGLDLGPDNVLALQWRSAKLRSPTDGLVVPLTGSAAREVPLLPWPRMSEEEWQVLQLHLERRLKAVLQKIMDEQDLGWTAWLAAKAALFSQTKSLVAFVTFTILSDLVKRDQIAGWELETPRRQRSIDVADLSPHRAVLVALLQPELSTYATPRSITDIHGYTQMLATSDGYPTLSEAEVGMVLKDLMTATGKPYEIWRAPSFGPKGESLYALGSRAPNWLELQQMAARRMQVTPLGFKGRWNRIFG
ncbi:patatin-like phospholipase family protein [Azorhizobium caulinodans]|uniref:patatin-like phospholipase family protein n=2 Tax=Azorhizobium caulinodans TaxID=7 RepID=UPI002FBF00CB